MASYQMFLDLKQSILKEIASKLESKKLMTDSLKIFFFDEIMDNAEHAVRANVQMPNSGKEKKKRPATEHQKRPATEHQKRVSHCMKLVRERYPEVRHQLCLGASQYMLSYLKENNCLDFSNESMVNEAIVMGAMMMNDKRGEMVFKTLEGKTKNEQKDNKSETKEEEDSDLESESSESSDSEPDDCGLASQSDSSDDEGV